MDIACQVLLTTISMAYFVPKSGQVAKDIMNNINKNQIFITATASSRGSIYKKVSKLRAQANLPITLI
jgi:hypothetical protein